MWLREILHQLPPSRPPVLRRRRTHGRASRLAEPVSPFATIPERFIQDMWHGLLFDAARLATTEGDELRVLDTGKPNRDRGPDFLNARVRIGGVEWRGDVEIHVRSSDWIAHRHSDDPRYDSVVLHVVLMADIWTSRLVRQDGSVLPELVLLPHIRKPIRSLFRTLRLRPEHGTIACAGQIQGVPPDLVRGWIEKLGLERVDERKRLLAQNVTAAGNAAELLYQAVFEALGYSKNGQPMLDLARRVPLQELRVLSQFEREALLLGSSGLLHATPHKAGEPKRENEYVASLRERFESLPTSRSIPRMRSVSWSFFRMRPTNFPPVRIAQGASLVADGCLLGASAVSRISDAVRSADALTSLRSMFDATPSAYWTNHVRLDRPYAGKASSIGRARRDRILINAVLPILLLIADQTGDTELTRAVFRIYQRIPSERDELVSMFAALDVASDSVVHSQGLHQLFRTRCEKGGCLSCVVGRHLMSRAEAQRTT